MQPEQELDIAVRAHNRGWYASLHRETVVLRTLTHMLDGLQPIRLIGDDAMPAQLLAAHLELGFDQQHAVRVPARYRGDHRYDVGQGDE